MADLWLACCVIKTRENSLSGSANLFKGVNVIDTRTKWFGNFRRFELSRVNLSHGSQNWFELSGVSRNRGFRKIWGKIVKLDWSKSKGNKVWFEISGGSGKTKEERLSGENCGRRREKPRFQGLSSSRETLETSLERTYFPFLASVPSHFFHQFFSIPMGIAGK